MTKTINITAATANNNTTILMTSFSVLLIVIIIIIISQAQLGRLARARVSGTRTGASGPGPARTRLDRTGSNGPASGLGSEYRGAFKYHGPQQWTRRARAAA